jgi:hypothetical protein
MMSLIPSQNRSVVLTAQTRTSSLLEEEHKSSVDSNAITSITSNNNSHINIISEARREETIESLSAELSLYPITTQPTTRLQPSVEGNLYREYDSDQFTSGAASSDEFFFERSIPDSSLSATASIFQSTTASPRTTPGSSWWQPQQNTTSDDFYESSQTEQQQQQQQQAWDYRPTMGYSNMTNGDYAAWGLQGGTGTNNMTASDDSKVEASSSFSQPSPPPHQQQRPSSRPERLLLLDTSGGDDDNTTVDSAHNVTSPTQSPLYGQSISEEHHHHHHHALLLPGQQSTVTTPSTVSTAPSTADDGSLGMDPGTLERLALRMDYAGELSALYPHHRRVPSWEVVSPHHQQQQQQQSSHNLPLYASSSVHADPTTMSPQLPPVAYGGGAQPQQPNAWANLHGAAAAPSRVASFRSEQEQGEAASRYGYPPMAPPSDNRWQQQQQQQQQARYEGHGPFLPRPTGAMDNRFFRQPQQQQPSPGGGAYGPYQQQQIPPRPHHPTAMSPVSTPPRTIRNQRGHPGAPSPNRPSPSAQQHTPGGGGSMGLPMSHTGSSSRSSSEILKTLLRKKACLYEPDPSRAVALVTWLVGRELASEFGFFTRQQLQAGVHACVSEKIDAGVITRTKVNRCMQIILNSCFHYIIPRPDGTEENGNTFRLTFAREVVDDVTLLRVLPAPWNNLTVDREAILTASAASEEDYAVDTMKASTAKSTPATSANSTPQSSPQMLGRSSGEKLSPRSKEDHDDLDGKRAVLLCFNENVRCAEDVFRSHNEFIRDTSHASNLQLSSQEWRAFFGKDAAGASYLWGNVGIPVLCSEVRSQTDALGMMTMNELSKFRTTWCAKRYDHDHELCGFAHIDVNSGWLRRSPTEHNYKDEMCPHVSRVSNGQRVGNAKVYMINECPDGVNCEFAHSPEEVVYHPRRYKTRTCASISRQGTGGCNLSDVCPCFHPAESYRFSSKKSDSRSGPRHNRQGAGGGSKGSHNNPSGAPIVFASPAPISRFEEHLLMPGLQNLYRRHCSVVRAHVRNPNACVCCYSCFGDDSGVGVDLASLSITDKATTNRGLPPPRRT